MNDYARKGSSLCALRESDNQCCKWANLDCFGCNPVLLELGYSCESQQSADRFSDSESSFEHRRDCFCDDYCVMFDDCCADHRDTCSHSFLTMEGKMTGTAVRTLQKLGSHGNPWGFEPGDRAPWTKEEEVPVLGNGGGNTAEDYEVVFWTGCFGAFDPRGQEVAATISRILKGKVPTTVQTKLLMKVLEKVRQEGFEI